MRGPCAWRLVDSGLVTSPESAALDEAILEAHIAGSVPNTLHFYVRSVPTVSVGYFQRVEGSLDLAECRRRGVQVVRRKSGGSSIYTDPGQLIYGLVVREGDVPHDRAGSFELVCSALARAIGSFGLEARFRAPNDVEVGGRKVSGNAQLRRKGSVLQHGTVIVDTDVDAMDAVLKPGRLRDAPPGKPSERIATLASLLGIRPDMEAVKSRVATEMGRTFGVVFEESRISELEAGVVRRLVDERYSRDDWNLRL